jgi:aminoglycoside/choline kinase family phosphotransferase
MPVSGANRRAAAVQALLTDLCRVPVAVERWERLEPWAVARVLLRGTGAERTAIVKWVRTGPARARTEPWRLRTELAVLRFLSDDLGLALAPRVIAADVSAGFLVLEDLAPRVALDHLIRRDGAAACLELLAVFARARGEL